MKAYSFTLKVEIIRGRIEVLVTVPSLPVEPVDIIVSEGMGLLYKSMQDNSHIALLSAVIMFLCFEPG